MQLDSAYLGLRQKVLDIILRLRPQLVHDARGGLKAVGHGIVCIGRIGRERQWLALVGECIQRRELGGHGCGSERKKRKDTTLTMRDEEREERMWEREEEMWERKKLVVMASLARKSEELYRMRSNAEAQAGKKAMRAWLVQRKKFALLHRARARK